jgi:LSD1 subclass zinc finger protein
MPTAMLKRFVCPICGAFGAMPPTTPFVQCDSCATVTDFDLGVARRHPDWPRHEALQQQLMARHAAAVEAARTAGDRATWVGIYAEIFRTLIESCPTVYPPQARDAAYREILVAFQSRHNGNLVFEASLVKSQEKMLDRAYDIVHDAEGWHAETLWPMFDLALAHFDEQDRLAAAVPPPADFAPQWLRRLGISMIAQEWLPRLAPAAQRELVERLGLARAYVAPAADEFSHCGGCGEDLPSPPTDDCGACRKPLDITRGAFACQTCGVSFHVVRGVERALCPYCAAELRESRMGLEARERSRRLFEFMDSELSLTCKLEDSPLTGFDVLDGPVTRKDLPWRMVRPSGQRGPGADRRLSDRGRARAMVARRPPALRRALHLCL